MYEIEVKEMSKIGKKETKGKGKGGGRLEKKLKGIFFNTTRERSTVYLCHRERHHTY